jgi:hypothetical protein
MTPFFRRHLFLITRRWHPTRPQDAADRAGIDHVVLAFAMANATASFQPKVSVSTIRSEFPNAKVMIAVGGWGDDIGFFQASKTDALIKQFAADLATMLRNTKADGVGRFRFRRMPRDYSYYIQTSIGNTLEATVVTTGKSQIRTRRTRSMPIQRCWPRLVLLLGLIKSSPSLSRARRVSNS